MSDRTESRRLLLVAANLGPGGAEKVMTMLANAWARQGYRITLITLDGSLKSFFSLDPAIDRLATETFVSKGGRLGRAGLLFRIVRDALKLRRIVRQIGPDAVLSFINSTNVVVLLALLGTRYPRIVSERSDPAFAPLGAAWRLLRSALYPTADRVVMQTPSAAGFFRGRIAGRVCVIPNPVVAPPVGSAPDINVPQPAIMSMGRFTEEKRFIDLIDAFAIIASRHPEWSLVIAGDGPLRPELERHVGLLGLLGRAHLPGVTRTPAELMSRADIFVLSSRFEGFPNALCEAMALGRAVVATDCPSGPRHIVSHGLDGLLVPPLEPELLANAVESLILSPEMRGNLGTAAASITEKFALGSILEMWGSAIRDSIAERGPANVRALAHP